MIDDPKIPAVRVTDVAPVLEAQSLTRDFGSLRAVDQFTITLEGGWVFGLLGPNGAGKSTVIKMLTTLLPPTSGTACIVGHDILRDAAGVRRVIGYVPQMLSADGALTGYENLLTSAKLYDVARSERNARVRAALAFMGLDGASHKLVREYSGGMIRRLEIAQALLHQPRVLFLDEPTLGLDPLARMAVWEHIETLRLQSHTTVFLTTHYMEEAERVCDHVAIMHNGKMVARGTPAALKAALGHGAATMNDVFAHFTGGELESGGTYRETAQTRRLSRRLG